MERLPFKIGKHGPIKEKGCSKKKGVLVLFCNFFWTRATQWCISTPQTISNLYTRKQKSTRTFLFYIIITMGKSAKHGIWSELLTGRSYGHKLNASEMHFARSFPGHPTWPYLACPNMRPKTVPGVFVHIWPYFGTHLSVPSMVSPWIDLVKCIELVSIGPPSQKLSWLTTKPHVWLISPL